MPTLIHAVLFAALAVQQSPTTAPCGWDESEIVDDIPVVVTSLLQRDQASAVPAEALTELYAWVRECDQGSARKAMQHLKRAMDRTNSDVVSALYGITLARGPDIQIPGGAGTIYRPARKLSLAEGRAVRILRDLAGSTGWPEPAMELATLGLALRKDGPMDASREALHAALAANPTDRLRALLADVEIARRDYAAAILAASGASPGESRAAGIARMLTESDPSAGATLYLDGLTPEVGPALPAYLDDIRVLMTEAEFARWDGLESDSARAAWLRQAWKWRASTAAISVPARLAEHFRRTAYAFEHYTRNSYRGAKSFDALWSMEYVSLPALDDRGIVYVRHGPPDQIERVPYPGATRMAWLYRSLAGGRATLEFDKDDTWTDYFLPDPATDCEPNRGPTESYRLGPHSYADALRTYGTYIALFYHHEPALGEVRARARVRCYGTIAGDPGTTRVISGGQLRRTVANAVYESESASPRLKKPLDLLLNTYAFRSAAGTTEIHAVVAVSAEEIIGKDAGGATLYSLSFYSAVEDPARHSVITRDTTLQMSRPGVFGADDVLRYHIRMVPDPSLTSTVRVSVRNAVDTTQGQIVSAVRNIPSYPAGQIAISDVVISEAGAGTWAQNGTRLAPVPGHRLPAGTDFRVYTEAYGLTNGEPVTMQIDITPYRAAGLAGRIRELVSKREAVALSFSESAAVTDDRWSINRIVGLDVKPGAYLLKLTITRQNGEQIEGAADLVVYAR